MNVRADIGRFGLIVRVGGLSPSISSPLCCAHVPHPSRRTTWLTSPNPCTSTLHLPHGTNSNPEPRNSAPRPEIRCALHGRTNSSYRGTSLIRNSAPLGPYSRNTPRPLMVVQVRGAVYYERGTPVLRDDPFGPIVRVGGCADDNLVLDRTPQN